MKKLEHIGIAVKELKVSVPLFERLLGSPCYKTEIVENERVNTAFFKNGSFSFGRQIELAVNHEGVANQFFVIFCFNFFIKKIFFFIWVFLLLGTRSQTHINQQYYYPNLTFLIKKFKF